MINQINGGVCAAKGFSANGVLCGRRKNRTKRDLALIMSEVPGSAAAVYTKNLVKGAPLTVTKNNIANGTAQAVICNSGNANTCNANGIEIAEQMCALVGKTTGIKADDVIVASTGVIGQPLSIDPISDKIEELAAGLGDKSDVACEAIMTTDTKKKEIAFEFDIDGVKCRIGGIAKGSGMIHPNMATMLVFLTCDCAITSEMLVKALKNDVETSFNMVSVDGDTSTNDMVSIIANGLANNPLIDQAGEAYDAFCEALHSVTAYLCKSIAADGEGATKLLECSVQGAVDDINARIIAKSVICSSLFKAAMFGADANWGRVLCAIGYSDADVDVTKVDVSFESVKGIIDVCKNGAGVPFSENLAKEILLESEIKILIKVGEGQGTAVAWGCDLTYEYVKINGDYRT